MDRKHAGPKSFGVHKKNIMDLSKFKVYIGESLSFAATDKKQAVYTSSDSEDEDITPMSTKNTPVQIPTRMQVVTAVTSHCVCNQ
jgi:hypothetical protein